MPPQPGTKKSQVKKKKGFFDRVSDVYDKPRKFVAKRGRELEDIATGLPAGAYMLADALQQAARPSFMGGDADKLINLGEQMGRQTYADIRHPTRNPTATALTLLGVASLGGGTVARGTAGLSTLKKTGSVRRGVRQAVGPQLYERSFAGVAKVPGQKARKYKNIPASRSSVLRGARKVTLDPIYSASAKRAARANVAPRLKKGTKIIDETSKDYLDHVIWDKKNGKRLTDPFEIKEAVMDAGYAGVRKKSGNIKLFDESAKKAIQPGLYARRTEARERDLRSRLHRQARGGDPEEFGSPKEVRARAEELARSKSRRHMMPPKSTTRAQTTRDVAKYLLGAPMNMVRASMYVRPRYAVQNLTGTAMLLAHQAGNLPRNVRLQQQIRKLDPEAYENIKHMSGQTGASAISIGAEGPGVGLVHKLGAIAQKPEEWTRPLGLIEEMHRTLRQGGRKVTAEDMAKFAKTTSKEGISNLLGANRRALEELVDYGRLGSGERAFMRSQIPIFYPMTKGFTRYAASFPSRHPVQAGVLSSLGREGKEYQREGFRGLEPPPWAPYAVPGWKKGTTLNPQNLYTFSPGMDVARQAAQPFVPGKMIPGLNLAQQAGPLPNLASSVLLGRDLATGYTHLGEDEGHSAFSDALKDFVANSVPGADILRSTGVNPAGIFPKSRTYPQMTIQEQLLYNLIGPAYMQRRTDIERFLKQSKDARKISRSRKWER